MASVKLVYPTSIQLVDLPRLVPFAVRALNRASAPLFAFGDP